MINPNSTIWKRKGRVAVDNDLTFGASKYCEYTAPKTYTFFDSFAFSFFFEVDSALPTNSMFQADLSTLETNFISLTYTPGTSRINFIYKSGGSTTNSFVIQFLPDAKNHIVFQKTAGDRLQIFVNSKMILDTANSNNVDFNGRVIRIGRTAGNAKGISNFSVFNKDLSHDEIQNIYSTGGAVPLAAQENCISHYPLTQIYYFKADAAFVAKHPQFIVGDVVALDSTEQYFKAFSYFVNNDFTVTWVYSANFVNTTTYFEYDGLGAGTRSAEYSGVGMPSVSSIVRVRFNVVSNTGTFWVWIGGTTAISKRLAVNAASGIVDVLLEKDAGSSDKIIFSNTDGSSSDVTAVWRIDYVEVLGYASNHAKLINFSDSEIGASATTEALSINDFYNKQTSFSLLWSKTWQPDQNLQQGLRTDVLYSWKPPATDFSFMGKFSYLDSDFNFGGAGNQIVSFAAGIQNWFDISLRNYNLLRVRIRTLGVSVENDLPLTEITGQNQPLAPAQNLGSFYYVVVTYNATTSDLRIIFYLKDKRYRKEIVIPAVVVPDLSLADIYTHGNPTAGAASNTSINRYVVAQEVVSNIEIEDFFNDVFVQPATSIADFIVNRNDSNTMTDLDGNHVLKRWQTLFTNYPANQDKKFIVDERTAIPLLRDAFQMDDTFTITTPTNVGDDIGGGEVTALFTIKINEGANLTAGTQIIAAFIGETICRYYAISDGRVRIQNEGVLDFMSYPQINYNIIEVLMNNILSEFGVLNTQNEVYVDGNYLVDRRNNSAQDITGKSYQIKGVQGAGISVLRFAVWDRILSAKEAAGFSNNKIYDFPENLKNGLVCYYDMNLDSFYEDGVNVLLKDYSENSYDAIVAGLTGGTSALQLADVPNHLVSIDSLR